MEAAIEPTSDLEVVQEEKEIRIGTPQKYEMHSGFLTN
jgi:hypothetical protein